MQSIDSAKSYSTQELKRQSIPFYQGLGGFLRQVKSFERFMSTSKTVSNATVTEACRGHVEKVQVLKMRIIDWLKIWPLRMAAQGKHFIGREKSSKQMVEMEQTLVVCWYWGNCSRQINKECCKNKTNSWYGQLDRCLQDLFALGFDVNKSKTTIS